MTNFIPIFPLRIVVYPGEQLNLHIFEPRYRQLINDCRESGKPFGIPSIINNKVSEMGTLVQVKEISKVYDDGKMDIKTEGISIFKILEIINELPDKLYSGAIVNYPDNIIKGSTVKMKRIIEGIRELHKSLGVKKEFEKKDEELSTYDVAHHAGLSLDQEYRLLEFTSEIHRQEYLKRHITRVLPLMESMNELRNRIRLNGHFKTPDSSGI